MSTNRDISSRSLSRRERPYQDEDDEVEEFTESAIHQEKRAILLEDFKTKTQGSMASESNKDNEKKVKFLLL